MEALLDRSRKYCVFMPDECFWRFEYKSHDDGLGSFSSWVAYRKRPGGDYVSLGSMPEIEVLHKLTEHSRKLDDEDRFDLIFHLELGGLQQFLDENRVPIELERDRETTG